MKKTIKEELKSKTIEELVKEVRDARSQISKLAIDIKTGKLENVVFVKNKKKDIARILTFLGQKKEGAKAQK